MQEAQVKVHNAEVGMQLSKAVYDDQGSLLLPKDMVLTVKTLSHLREHQVDYIFIYQAEEEKNEYYLSAIRRTERFQTFDKAHQQSVQLLKQSLNSILVDNAKIDETKLMDDMNTLLSASTNNMQVLDMLHCIRNYDDSTYVHSVNVALICHVMGKWLNFSQRDIQILTLCGLLHDVGKLMMPKEIIQKPGKLTDGEFETIKTHPYVGYQIIDDEEMDQHIKKCILQHHEKCDGSGYPYGLTGKEIDEFAKIVTIADIYDAMTANRVYREGLCPFDVIRAFEEGGFDKYDAKYLLVFLERIVETYINKYVRLSNGQEGQIIMINKHALSKPVVRTGNGYIDLSKEYNLNIEALL